MVTFVLVTDGDEKFVVKVPYIYYLVQFQEDQKSVKALLNSSSKANIINLDNIWKLEFNIRKIYNRAQKINSSILKTFGIIIADFQDENKISRPKFF